MTQLAWSSANNKDVESDLSHLLPLGTVALRQIQCYQKSTTLLLRHASVNCSIQEGMQNRFGVGKLRMTLEALAAIHEAMVAYLAMHFEYEY